MLRNKIYHFSIIVGILSNSETALQRKHKNKRVTEQRQGKDPRSQYEQNRTGQLHLVQSWLERLMEVEWFRYFAFLSLHTMNGRAIQAVGTAENN